MNRNKFLKITAGTAASLLVTNIMSPAIAREAFFEGGSATGDAARELLTLQANPPSGTTAVRYFIDDMQFSEITDLYAVKTNTKPVWKTVIDPAWLNDGEHTLRIEADTPTGKQIVETKTIKGTHKNIPQKVSLNGEWNFAEMSELPAGALEGTTPAATTPGYKQGTWTKVFVPNSIGAVSNKWNIYEGILGMYRRTVHLTNIKKDEQLAIILQSCYWSGRVFINGVDVGETHGGYLPSRFNITKAIKEGDNEVTVIIDTRFSTRGAFKRLNEFYWNWGGLVQEVEIQRHPSVSLTDLRAEGTMSGSLNLHVKGLNATATTQKKTVTVEISNAANKKILGPIKVTVEIPAGENIITLNPLRVPNPTLWNLEKPYLYTVVVTGDFGTITERTGFRDVKVDGRDVVINGQVVENLQGFDRHADYPGLGRTQPAGLAYQELKMLRDKGFRFFRPAHYPTTPALLDAADELGLLVIEEINVTGLKGAVLASKEVMDFGAQQIRKMIERDRSHPSIIAWSVGNENLTEEDGAEKYVNHVISLGRSLDARRLYTQVTHRHTTDKTFKYQDFICQNYYAGWYAKDVNVIGNMLETVQAYAGNKPIILSEYGAEAVPGKAGVDKSTEFYQGFVVDAHNRILNNKKHFFGKMYWCSTDFWCRPVWNGGSPFPVSPFHVKSLISFNREHKKLGWRVMFSPVRLIFNPHTVKNTDLGGYVEIAADKPTTITQVITVKEVRGQQVKGKVLLELPKGFTATQTEYPFEVKPNENKSITISFTGTLATADKTLDCFVKAIIDEDTEAQPLLLSLNIAPEKKT